MKYLYLHGLGQTPDNWNDVIRKTNVSGSSNALDLPRLLEGKSATYPQLYAAFSGVCEKEEELVLCGLSLGAVLALNYAIDHPNRVKALVLIAPQYKMPKKLLKIQNAVFHLIPNSMFTQTGFQKKDFITLCGSMAELDFRLSLDRVSCPVLILCGQRDKANKQAAKELTQALSQAHFQELPETGHEANRESPEQLAQVLQHFYDAMV